MNNSPYFLDLFFSVDFHFVFRMILYRTEWPIGNISVTDGCYFLAKLLFETFLRFVEKTFQYVRIAKSDVMDVGIFHSFYWQTSKNVMYYRPVSFQAPDIIFVPVRSSVQIIF